MLFGWMKPCQRNLLPASGCILTRTSYGGGTASRPTQYGFLAIGEADKVNGFSHQ